jgi:hypothetical protein
MFLAPGLFRLCLFRLYRAGWRAAADIRNGAPPERRATGHGTLNLFSMARI